MPSPPPRPPRVLVAAIAALTIASGCGSASGDRQRVTVLAASSLTSVLEDIEVAFEARHPDVDVVVSTGGSPTLAAQAADRAPASLLITADDRSMQTAVVAGVVDDGPVTVATNRVVLVRPRDTTVVEQPQDFARADPVIVLCAPEVPCGASAAALLDAVGVTADADSSESSVQAVVTRLLLGEADGGVVYRTDVEGSGGALTVIDDDAPETVGSVRYLAAVLSEADGGDALVEFITGDEGLDLLTARGFGRP